MTKKANEEGNGQLLLSRVEAENIRYQTGHSILTGYIDFVRNYVRKTEIHVVAIALNMADLYQIAFSGILGVDLTRNRVRIETKVKQRHLIRCPGEQLYGPHSWTMEQWLRKYGYCYEIQVPASDTASLYHLMRDDLDTYFMRTYRICGGVEHRFATCFVLSRRPDEIGETVNKNELPLATEMPVDKWIERLRTKDATCGEMPLVNESGCRVPAALEVLANLQDLNGLNYSLKEYELRITLAQRQLDMVIIKNTK